MLVDNLKLFFFHVPRTGGTSINRWFLENNFLRREKLIDNGLDLSILYGKLRLGEVTIELDTLTQEPFAYFCSEYVQDEFKKLVVLRPPIERAFSVYKRMKATGDRRLLPARSLESFRTWCEEVYALKESGLFDRPFEIPSFPHDKVSHLIPQSAYVLDSAGKINVDFVLMQPELSESWPELIRKLGVNPAWVEHPLSQSAASIKDMVVPEMQISDPETAYERDLLFKIYERDFELMVDHRVLSKVVRGKAK